MSDSTDHRPASWWTTLPGILTGVAALITAVAGVFFGIMQLNTGSAPATAPARPSSSASLAPGRTAASTPPVGERSAGPAPLDVAVSHDPVRVGDAEYTVQNALTRADTDGMVAIEFTVRCFNYGRYDLNFWDQTFRAQLGSETYAPTSFLDDVVPGDSSKTGMVRFVLPDGARSFALTIRFPEGDRNVTVVLAPRS
ncbi:hypothetical protein RBS60_03620 [Sinomonas sp. ASV486]|uniref:hypothetical protein n=1 Tax=Sinomonas sp. ASV486 TaxID=3051170 RepID=UPI0027DEA377|nr:hypothetical protein [Sinomonas sp. ASV486]MDQ4489284.1 hypothetical protein [Sinomonas sp. ASV486]